MSPVLGYNGPWLESARSEDASLDGAASSNDVAWNDEIGTNDLGARNDHYPLLLDQVLEDVAVVKKHYCWKWNGRVTATMVFIVQAICTLVLTTRRLRHVDCQYFPCLLALHNPMMAISAVFAGLLILCVLVVKPRLEISTAVGAARNIHSREQTAKRERRSTQVACFFLYGSLIG